MSNEKLSVALISIISNTLLTLGKLFVGITMNSVSVISEAIHSGLDLVAALIAYFSVWQSGKPADDVHRYGHGKFENVAAIIEAFLILGAAGVIIWQAVLRLYRGGEVESLGLGMVVMGISAAVNFVVSGMLMRTARKTDSPALEADAWHLRTDVYTSLGVFGGIIAIKITGLYFLDPIIALAVTGLIIKAAIDLLRKSIGSIVDARLSDEEEKLIREVLRRYSGEYVHYHQLRTRRSGPERHIDLHLVVPRRRTIFLAHELCDRIEKDVREAMLGVSVLIHAEPCQPGGNDCPECEVYCRENPGWQKVKGKCEDCEGCD